MAIKQEHDLPQRDPNGIYPDAVPRFGQKLAEAWRAQNEANFNKPTRAGTMLRISMAGSCARNIEYFARGIVQSNPPSTADHWRMGIGTLMHEALQPVIEAAFPGAESEVLVDLRTKEPAIDLSGSMDLLLTTADSTRVLLEIKTINGFGFKQMIGARGVPEGAKSMHILQAALGASHLGCDELVVVYLSLENLSPREQAKLGTDDLGRFIAEFTLTKAQFEPLAHSERARQLRIEQLVKAGETVPRSIPDLPFKAKIVDPSRGAWTLEVNNEVVQSGTTWMCGYCNHRDTCIADPR